MYRVGPYLFGKMSKAHRKVPYGKRHNPGDYPFENKIV